MVRLLHASSEHRQRHQSHPTSAPGNARVKIPRFTACERVLASRSGSSHIQAMRGTLRGNAQSLQEAVATVRPGADLIVRLAAYCATTVAVSAAWVDVQFRRCSSLFFKGQKVVDGVLYVHWVVLGLKRDANKTWRAPNMRRTSCRAQAIE